MRFVVRSARAFLLALSSLVGLGCHSEPATVETTPASVPAEVEAGKLVFAEPVTDEPWREAVAEARPLLRVEFLADDQEAVDLTLLAQESELKRFRFDGPFECSWLSYLSSCPALEILNLQDTRGDEPLDVDVLSRFAGLTSLRLGGDGVGDAVLLDAAIRWPKLRHVHLLRTSVSQEALDALAEVDSLESFYLDAVTMPEGALARFAERRSDVHLHVDQLHLPDDASTHTH